VQRYGTIVNHHRRRRRRPAS